MPPVPSNFFGREAEIKTLKEWIIKESRPVVSIRAMAGMGKTALAVKLAHTPEIQDRFDYIIGRSLENPLSLNQLIQDIIQFLSDGQKSSVPEERGKKIELLRSYLREKRCLIIIDNLEGIWQGGEPGEFREGYGDYENFLSELVKGNNQENSSCLLLTSRDKPPAVIQLEQKNYPVKSLELRGLDPKNGKEIFKLFGSFKGSDQEWKKVIEHYKGNPEALRIVAPLVRDKLGGDLSKLVKDLERKYGFNNGLRDLLKRQYENTGRLSEEEKAIIYWLAIERQPVDSRDLAKDIAPEESDEDVILDTVSQIDNILDNLVNKSMIELRDSYYTLHPFVREYFTEKIIENIYQNIFDYGKIQDYQNFILNTHAIIKAQSKVYIRESQIIFILKPIVQKLKKGLKNKENIENHLRQLILDLQTRFSNEEGYAAGNILNILVIGLKTDLKAKVKDYNFSNLTIREAYLQECYLQGINFTNSVFDNCVFGDIIDGVFSVAFSKVDYDIVDQYEQQKRTKLVAAGDLNGQYHIYELQNFKKIAPKSLIKSIGLIWSLAFHPTKKILATGSDYKTVILWNIDTNEREILGEHDQPVHSVCFNNDGTILASSSSDRTIKIWHLNSQTGKYDHEQTLGGHNNAVWSIAFSPDGKILASGSDDKTIKLWRKKAETNKWECDQTLTGHDKSVRSVAFNREGKLLASCSQDNTVRLWNIETENHEVLKGHEDWVWCVAFNPDGKTLASCSDDETIKIWDLKTRKLCYTLRGHNHAVRSIAFSSDGKFIFSGSYDRSVKLWEWDRQNKRGQCIKTRLGLSTPWRTITFSPDSNILASGGSDKIVRLWQKNPETAQYEERQLKEEHKTFIWSLAFHPDGEILASCSDDKTIKLWNIKNDTCDQLGQKLTHRTRAVAFSPDGKFLAVGSNDYLVKLYERGSNTETWLLRDTLGGHNNWVWSVAFSSDSSDSKMLASCSEDHTIKIWNIEEKSANLLYTLYPLEHTSMVYSVAFSPTQKILASSSADHTIKLWNLETGDCLKTLEGHQAWVWSVAFTPDGKTLASGSSDCTVKLWDVETGECLWTSEEINGHTQWIRTVAISPDGKILASAGDESMIKLWDIQDVRNVRHLDNLIPEKPYEGMIITGATLTQPRKSILKVLGAIE